MSGPTEAKHTLIDRLLPLGRRLRGMLSWIDATLPWRVLLLVAVVAVALHVLGALSLPFWPFTTAGGSIHVDSPEVYTRERLVNDRYEQDYWLREQLRLLNQVTPGDLAAGRLFTGARIDIGDRPAGGDDGASPAGDVNVDRLDFRDRYEVLSGIRDMLRQQILENMLDDRHDLTANSVYGLKFDTTVIPGKNTYRRAFVEVELKPVDLFLHEGATESSAAESGTLNGLDQFQRVYLCKLAQLAKRALAGCDGIDRALADYHNQRVLYHAWLQDIEKRLNSAEASLFKVIAAQEPQCPAVPSGITPERYAELIGRSLEVVLNLPQKRFIIDHHGRLQVPIRPAKGGADNGVDAADGASGVEVGPAPVGNQIRLPEPYSKYMQITATPIWIPNAKMCSLRVALDVEPVRERYIARRVRDEADTAAMATPPKVEVRVAGVAIISSADVAAFGNLLALAQSIPGMLQFRVSPCDVSLAPLWKTADGGWQLLMDGPSWQFRQSIASDFGVVYQVPGRLLDAIARSGLAPLLESKDCLPQALEQYQIDLPSGLFNFIDSMREVDAYTYAVFPKNDVRGVLQAIQASGGAGGPGGGIGFLRQLSESRTEPLLVGYGDAREADDDADAEQDSRSVSFGWVIASPGKMQPSLKTQLALVSVPAWTNQLTINVTTGWLDRGGRRHRVRNKVPMEVKLPPDYGAFDSIFRDQGWVTPAPQIRDQNMDQAIYVVAGQEASILIPGLRLWRSTSVTLGSQLADRIRVLPNMEGIIADFRPVRLPFAKYKPLPAGGGSPDIDAGAGVRDEPPRCTLREERADGTLGEVPPAFMGLEVRAVRLRVWTSEGAAVASQHACVVYDPQRQVRDGMARLEQGAWVMHNADVPGAIDDGEVQPGGQAPAPVAEP